MSVVIEDWIVLWYEILLHCYKSLLVDHSGIAPYYLHHESCNSGWSPCVIIVLTTVVHKFNKFTPSYYRKPLDMNDLDRGVCAEMA